MMSNQKKNKKKWEVMCCGNSIPEIEWSKKYQKQLFYCCPLDTSGGRKLFFQKKDKKNIVVKVVRLCID